jgi:hypothetical protein
MRIVIPIALLLAGSSLPARAAGLEGEVAP